jgi:hypothetical protein
MKTSSAKAKGRRFQQWVRDQLIETLSVHPEDIESRSMGAGGEDLIMARAARQRFPYSIEIIQALETHFKIEMPSPINYPNSFMYYLNIYRMYKKNELVD